ncbi:MAG: MFS transporter [Solirubrobacterales bacterium]|nr:MFS transporter [Solirubrobacterales bacterium]
MLIPGSLAILASTFEGAERGKAIGTWTAWTGIATVFGPAGGGALVEAFSWRAIFWINVPLILFTIVMTLRVVNESRDPQADRTIDWAGIAMSAAGLGLPVFVLIEQPTHGWGSPIVYGPLIGGIALFALFLVWEWRYPHSMLDLSLFRVRNFAVTNLETLIVYAGLMGAFFFITLFLQQTAGYSPIQAGFATTPISLLLFFLSPRFGRISTSTGPRLPMSLGPIVAGAGLLLMTRIGADANYLTEVLPGVLLFGLGLSATVAPLTATALDSVEERRVGVASGINNGVSRVAGLLAIAVLGAVIAGSFDSKLDRGLAAAPLTRQAQGVVEDAKAKPLAVPETKGLPAAEADRIQEAASAASVDSFHLGLELAGILMIIGGVIAGIGIQNPRRREAHGAPLAATAGDCGHEAEGGRPVEPLEPVGESA